MVDETESKIAHNYEEGDQQRKMKYESEWSKACWKQK